MDPNSKQPDPPTCQGQHLCSFAWFLAKDPFQPALRHQTHLALVPWVDTRLPAPIHLLDHMDSATPDPTSLHSIPSMAHSGPWLLAASKPTPLNHPPPSLPCRLIPMPLPGLSPLPGTLSPILAASAICTQNLGPCPPPRQSGSLPPLLPPNSPHSPGNMPITLHRP